MIIDASVAIKWLVREDDSDHALALLDRSDLIAPDLLACEVANAIWKKRRRGELSDMPTRLGFIMAVFSQIEPTHRYLARAAAIAVEIDHAAYDCFYLALAEDLAMPVITADQRFLAKVVHTPFAAITRPLQ